MNTFLSLMDASFNFDFDGHSNQVFSVHYANDDVPCQTRFERGVENGIVESDHTVIGNHIVRAGQSAMPLPICPNLNVLGESLRAIDC